MDEKTRGIISEPDENGVRYYSMESPGQRQEESRGERPDPWKQPGRDSFAGMEAGRFAPGSGAGGRNGNGNGSGGGRKKRRKKPVIIFACVIAAVLLLGLACSSMDKDEDSRYANLSDDHISVLYISGTISGQDSSNLTESTDYSHSWVLDRIDDAMNNSSNKGLILFVDSPGGSVYETDEVYLKLLEYKKTGRPLYSAMGSMAASGGYYISAPADKIIANRNCWTGSIGVIVGTFYDISELLDRYGVKAVNITSGRNKAMGSMTEPMTREQKAIFQSLVDEAYEQFVRIVADGRNMPASRVKKLADGRIYTAKQALDNGLIDRIGTLDDAISDMKKNYGLADCAVSEMQYQDNSFFKTLFGALSGQKAGGADDVAALLELMKEQGKTPVSYMADIQK